MKSKNLSMVLLVSFLSATVSFAQMPEMQSNASFSEGSHVGGGGEDILFKSIRDELKIWLTKNARIGKLEEKLSLTSISGTEVLDRYESAIASVGDKIIFNHDEIKFGNNIRICKNDRDSMTITCNIDEWKKANGKLQYAITFHEFLGLAQLENNQEVDYSRYPISGKIVRYVKSIEAFELGMEAAYPSCSIKLIVGNGVKGGESEGLRDLVQTKLEKLHDTALTDPGESEYTMYVQTNAGVDQGFASAEIDLIENATRKTVYHNEASKNDFWDGIIHSAQANSLARKLIQKFDFNKYCK